MDYSKIDFSKFPKREWKGIAISVSLANYNSGIVRVVAEGVSAAVARRKDTGWVYTVSDATAPEVTQLKTICAEVDTFIATEVARIEAEEEAANWVSVPWQDVNWLIGIGAIVEYLSSAGRWHRAGQSNYEDKFRVNRNTIPDSYDPTKPRWVEVKACDVLRLEGTGITCYTRLKSDCGAVAWSPRASDYLQSGINREYAVDIHTLPPGVPLHVETTQDITFDQHLLDGREWPRSVNFVGRSGFDPVEPKPEPRPCTKEFASAHKEDSEARLIENPFGESFDLQWHPIGAFTFAQKDSLYEFRTTAKEEIAKPIIEFVASLKEVNYQNGDVVVHGYGGGFVEPASNSEVVMDYTTMRLTIFGSNSQLRKIPDAEDIKNVRVRIEAI